MWKVYILESESGALYTGITTDLERRIKEHQQGQGARFFRMNPFKQLVYEEPHPDRSSASKREYAIKSLSRKQKLDLVKNKKNNSNT